MQAEPDARSSQALALGNDSIPSTTSSSSSQRSSTTNHRHHQPQQGRTLRDLVQDSTEKWQLPTDEANREYYEELRAMGYQNEEVQDRMQERGRDYHGMLQMGCLRYLQYLPVRIPHLKNIRITSVSAGYAHVMLLSDNGLLYAAGYNDRGQLGLG